MKKAIYAIFAGLAAWVSCTNPVSEQFSALDRAIDRQEMYDLLQTHVQDSLSLRYQNTMTDSLKWEAAYKLQSILSYRDIESCYNSIQDMLDLCGDDRRQKCISESCYANILYKMDSIAAAQRVLQQIDTAGMCREALAIYCFAAYHIYGRLSADRPQFNRDKLDIIEKWWNSDSTRIECAYYYNVVNRSSQSLDNSVRRLKDCVLTSPNDTAKANYFLALEYMHAGDNDNAIKYFAKSAECDMRLAVKAYNALYELALLLFRTGDIKRADRYMRITLKDAYSSHYESRYDDVIGAELEIMNVLMEGQRQRRRAIISTTIAIAMLLVVAVVSLFLLSRYSSRLSLSRKQLSEASKIKDSFLAMYMEKCVDYLNKVDEYRSSLRRASRQGGQDAVTAMLRRPSFADEEFDGLLENFDSAFLGIFPDFVEKVNGQMLPEYRLDMPAPGELSTELRILALIRMGVSKRQKIAKILNMSVTTVYSYHSNLQKHSLHPYAGFDEIISNL